MINTTVFAKARRTHEGKPFTAYCTTLTRKDGTTQYADVRFRQEAGTPKDFPINIKVLEGNVSKRKVTDAYDGSTKEYYTLWVKRWEASEEKFVDNSLDEFQ